MAAVDVLNETPEERAIRRAKELIVFADGVEAANPSMREYAQRARAAARDCMEYVSRFQAEHGLRRAMQEQRDEARRLKRPG